MHNDIAFGSIFKSSHIVLETTLNIASQQSKTFSGSHLIISIIVIHFGT